MNFHYSNGSSKFKPGLQILVWLINGGGGGGKGEGIKEIVIT